MKFLRNFLASLLALFVFTVGGFFLFVIIASLMEGSEKVTLRSNSVLKIELNQMLADRDFDDPLANLSFAGNNLKRIGVINLRNALEHAKEDDKIKGVVLSAPTLIGGFGYGEELRNALEDFKTSGKFIYSYADILTEGGYYISSVADSLYISPQGSVEWNGLSVEMSFFKGTFEKLEIEPQIFRVGDYKSAVEPFILDKMSKDNRAQLTSSVESIYKQMVSEVAKDIHMPAKELRKLSDDLAIRTAEDAVNKGLITGLIYKDEFEQLLASKIGEEDPDDINYIDYQDYNKSYSSSRASKNKIAVVIADGEIINAKPEQGIITAAQFVKQLKKVRENDRIKAVVFRINSPGGDALVSDLIWRAVDETRKIKPVIASFANYGASGGYYIGMAADSIVAEPNTITGSIGVFAMIFNIGDFMSHKLGITTDYVTTGDYSGMWTSSRALTSEEKQIIQNGINHTYEVFTSKAAEGRHMNVESLRELASGRVWTGSQAVENGLVDVLGGLDDAIDIAAAKAGVEDNYQVRYYPTSKTSVEKLIEELSGKTQDKIAREKLGDMYPYLDLIKKLKSLRGLQARMPFEFDVR